MEGMGDPSTQSTRNSLGSLCRKDAIRERDFQLERTGRGLREKVITSLAIFGGGK